MKKNIDKLCQVCQETCKQDRLTIVSCAKFKSIKKKVGSK